MSRHFRISFFINRIARVTTKKKKEKRKARTAIRAVPLSVTCVPELSRGNLVLYNAKRINVIFIFLFIVHFLPGIFLFIYHLSFAYTYKKLCTGIDYLRVKYSKRLTMIWAILNYCLIFNIIIHAAGYATNSSREYLLICENYTNSGKFILETTMTDVLVHNEGKLRNYAATIHLTVSYAKSTLAFVADYRIIFNVITSSSSCSKRLIIR